MPEHVPHCLAMNEDWVCNRDKDHPGPHESRHSSTSGCIGWARSENETYYVRPTLSQGVLEAAGMAADRTIRASLKNRIQ